MNKEQTEQVKNETVFQLQSAIDTIKAHKPTDGYYMLQHALNLALAALREMQERAQNEPPYDPNYQGLKHKYNVYKAEDDSRVENCFVLRPDKDLAAVEALRAYAGATDNALLAADIWGWVGQPEPLTLDELMALDGEPVFLEVANGEWGLVNTRDGIIRFSGGGDISISHAVGCAYRTKPGGRTSHEQL